MHESDVFFVVQLFGFRKPDGARRFSMALKAIARKNAKSTVAAAIGLYCQCCEDELGPQVISGATTGKQARIVFGVAKRMVEKTSALRDAFGPQAAELLRRALEDRVGEFLFIAARRHALHDPAVVAVEDAALALPCRHCAPQLCARPYGG